MTSPRTELGPDGLMNADGIASWRYSINYDDDKLLDGRLLLGDFAVVATQGSGAHASIEE